MQKGTRLPASPGPLSPLKPLQQEKAPLRGLHLGTQLGLCSRLARTRHLHTTAQAIREEKPFRCSCWPDSWAKQLLSHGDTSATESQSKLAHRLCRFPRHGCQPRITCRSRPLQALGQLGGQVVVVGSGAGSAGPHLRVPVSSALNHGAQAELAAHRRAGQPLLQQPREGRGREVPEMVGLVEQGRGDEFLGVCLLPYACGSSCRHQVAGMPLLMAGTLASSLRAPAPAAAGGAPATTQLPLSSPICAYDRRYGVTMCTEQRRPGQGAIPRGKGAPAGRQWASRGAGTSGYRSPAPLCRYGGAPATVQERATLGGFVGAPQPAPGCVQMRRVRCSESRRR